MNGEVLNVERNLLGFVRVESGRIVVADPIDILPGAGGTRSGPDYSQVIAAPAELVGFAISNGNALVIQGIQRATAVPIYGEYVGDDLVGLWINFTPSDRPT